MSSARVYCWSGAFTFPFNKPVNSLSYNHTKDQIFIKGSGTKQHVWLRTKCERTMGGAFMFKETQVWSCVPEENMKNWVLNCLEICFLFKSTFFFFPVEE